MLKKLSDLAGNRVLHRKDVPGVFFAFVGFFDLLGGDIKKPGSKYPFQDVYVNPPDRYSSLALRIFPERVNNEPNPLAKQI